MDTHGAAPAAESESPFPGPLETLFRRSVVPAKPWASLRIVHGYGDHSGRYLHFMRWMAERGVACHAMDLRGQGRATGRRGFVRRWEEYLDDVDAFVKLPELLGDAPAFMLGHSHGGLVLAAYMERDAPEVSGCVMTAPYLAPKVRVPRHKKILARLLNPLLPWARVASGLGDEMLSSDALMLEESRADPLLARAATPRWYLESLAAQARVLSSAGEFRAPLLMLFGDADRIADLEAARKFFEAAGSPDKVMRVFPAMLHEMLRETGRGAVFTEVLQWLARKARDEPG